MSIYLFNRKGNEIIPPFPFILKITHNHNRDQSISSGKVVERKFIFLCTVARIISYKHDQMRLLKKYLSSNLIVSVRWLSTNFCYYKKIDFFTQEKWRVPNSWVRLMIITSSTYNCSEAFGKLWC